MPRCLRRWRCRRRAIASNGSAPRSYPARPTNFPGASVPVSRNGSACRKKPKLNWSNRMKRTASMLLCAVCCVAVPQVDAAETTFPSKPVRIIVPFAAGGPTDIVARTVGQQLTLAFGQPVVIDNRPGAGGVVGADLAVKSAPDGYTLLLCSTGAMAINPGLLPSMPYDPVRDLAPITLVVTI